MEVIARIGFLALLSMPSLLWAKDTVISSDPPGAEVYADGRLLGRTPLTTDRKGIMPGWATDGAITRSEISIRLPMHVPYVVTVSEWKIPKLISATLEIDNKSVHFENYLDSVDGLDEKTDSSQKAASFYVSDDLDADSIKLEQDGYLLVGYVGVSASVISIDLLREYSEKIKGSVIISKSSDAGVQTEMRAVKSTISSGLGSSIGQASTIGNVSATGVNAAPSNAFLSSSTTSNSLTFIPSRTTTSWVPYSTRQYSTQATIWRKRKSDSWGLSLDSVPAHLRAELQRNSGAYVAGLAEGSLAFLSDVLVGDVIIDVNGHSVRQPSDFYKMADGAVRGASLIVTVIRNGRDQVITLKSDG